MNELTPILAIETSDSICGVCVYLDDNQYFSSKLLLKHSHSEKLFELIQITLKEAEVNLNEIKAIAVSEGPGSFTGLRIGIAAAKGISQASSKPIIPVPTFEALALQISSYLPENYHFVILNKVGKDEMYFGKFHIKSNNYIFKEELKIIQKDELNSLSENTLIFGNIVGEEINHPISAPDPEYIAKWAVKFGADKEVIDIDYLEPNYLKEFLVKEKKL